MFLRSCALGVKLVGATDENCQKKDQVSQTSSRFIFLMYYRKKADAKSNAETATAITSLDRALEVTAQDC